MIETSGSSRLAHVDRILVLRPNSGVSGDMLVTGLAQMANLTQTDLDSFLTKLNLGHLIGRIRFIKRSANSILGHGLELDLPPEAEHHTCPT